MSKAKYVTGLRPVEQLLIQRETKVLRLYTEYRTPNARLEVVIAKAKQQGIEIQSANRARLQQICGEGRHQGVVAEIRRGKLMDEGDLRSLVEDSLTAEKKLLLLILDNIQDPQNLGACLRTADAAGVDAVIVPRHGAAGLGPAVSKVAAGAAETIPFVPVTNTGKVINWIKEYGVAVIGTSGSAGKTVYDCDLAPSLAIVMGEEYSGLRKHIEKRCDQLVSLPMLGSVSSLNVSVATGIVLYETVRQRNV